MKLTVLIENTSPDSTLLAEHGLSFFVETPRKKFLFDCGHTDAAWSNAKILGVDLSQIKFVALSHSHYDHAGGFPSLLNFAPIEKIFTGENFWAEKFSSDEFGGVKYRGCGFDEKFLAAHDVEQIICRDVTEIDSGAWLVANFPRRNNFETIPKKFLLAKKIPDDFRDEIVLVLRGDDGLAVVTACAHSGIVNIVESVREKFSAPVSTVIGGLHLVNADDERIAKTLTALKNFGIKKILPCHCSGENFMRNFERLSTGSVIEL